MAQVLEVGTVWINDWARVYDGTSRRLQSIGTWCPRWSPGVIGSPVTSIRGDSLLVTLRDISDEDLPLFFEHQRDPDALRMAAFSSRERDAFMTHWRTKVLRPENVNRAILVDGVVAGHLGSWSQEAMRCIGYWLGREHWGQGIATRALAEFLVLEPRRPLHAWVARHNVASIRVLEKCGFRTVAPPEQDHGDGIPMVFMRLGPAGLEPAAGGVPKD